MNEQMSEWQPIETAPKDGSQVLVWDQTEGVCTARFQSHVEEWRASWGSEEWIQDGSVYDDALVARKPTHWMPLPAPPKSPNAP